MDLVVILLSILAVEGSYAASDRSLIDQAGCRRCHVLGGKGNSYASSLDQSLREEESEVLKKRIRFPAQLMPRFEFAEQDLSKLMNEMKSQTVKQNSSELLSEPRVVFFQKKGEALSPFEKHCGGCHRFFSDQWGPMGNSDVGPNLSGIQTSFYPRLTPEKKRWNASFMKEWIRNPRQFVRNSLMPPLRGQLKNDDIDNVLKMVFGDSHGIKKQ